MKKSFVIFIIFAFFANNTSANNWDDILENGSGKVTIYYFPSKPFVYRDEFGKLRGIEKEILDSFFRFLEKKYEVKIFQDWVEVNAFENLVENVMEGKENAFGVSNISRTEDRAKSVGFSNAYMPDVSVLITHISVPFLKDSLTLINSIKGYEAATIANTTYELDLRSLERNYGLKFDHIEAASEANIIQLVSKKKKIIGYVGLPFYVIEINKGIQVKRQGDFQVKRDGYRFIYQKNKGWEKPVKNYFDSYLYKAEADKIIRKYLGNDYSELIWSLASDQDMSSRKDEIDFLTKEKEIQSRSLIASQKEQELQRFIIISISVGLIFIFLFALLLIRTNRVRAKDNVLLTEKGNEMEKLLNQLNSQKTEISHQRQLLQKKNIELTSINNQKDELIGIVAHDLKSPINQMSGLISLLGYKNDTWDADELMIYQKLESSNQHLKELVERILDLEAIGKKSLNYLMDEVDMAVVMKETLEDFKEKAMSKNINLESKELEDNLMINADPFFLRQVFENLLSNAIKFSSSDTTVHISSDEMDGYYHISIMDEGPGISKPDQKKLFTKYLTLSAKPTGDESSTGLGLSIVKRYVEEMNGSVWCESQLGKGANFIVAFPKAY